MFCTQVQQNVDPCKICLGCGPFAGARGLPPFYKNFFHPIHCCLFGVLFAVQECVWMLFFVEFRSNLWLSLRCKGHITRSAKSFILSTRKYVQSSLSLYNSLWCCYLKNILKPRPMTATQAFYTASNPILLSVYRWMFWIFNWSYWNQSDVVGIENLLALVVFTGAWAFHHERGDNFHLVHNQIFGALCLFPEKWWLCCCPLKCAWVWHFWCYSGLLSCSLPESGLWSPTSSFTA